MQALDHLEDGLSRDRDYRLRASDAAPRRTDPGRVVMQTRRWEDFLASAVTAIREHGAINVQLNRRCPRPQALREEVCSEHRPPADEPAGSHA